MSSTYRVNSAAPELERWASGTPPRGISGFMEAYAGWLVVAFSLFYWPVTCRIAADKPLWTDEVVTRYLIALPGAELIRALKAGFDGQPPLFFYLTRLTGAAGSPLGLRLPGIFGIWLAAVCLYAFVSRRTSRVCGLFAMLLPLLLGSAPHAYDARPYGLLLGAAAATLACWQAAGDDAAKAPRWLTIALLWLAATLTVSISYYGVLALAPLAIGELLRWNRRRKLDFPVWIALGLSLVPLVLALPIIRGLKGTLSVFWSRPKLPGSFYDYYDTMVVPAITLLAAVFMAALVGLYLARGSETAPSPRRRTPELAAVIGFAVLPVVYILAGFRTGAFVPRYAIVGVLGICAGMGYLLARHRGVAAACVVLAAGRLVLQEYSIWRHIEPPRTVRLPETAGAADLPVVLSSPNEFFEASYYAPPGMAARLYYVAEPRLALQYVDTDVVDIVAQRIAQIRPLHVVSYAEFTAAHPHFWVVHWREDFGWVRQKLLDDGATLVLRRNRDGEAVYDVTVRPLADAGGSVSRAPDSTEPRP